MNIARARHVLESPHLPWTTEVKESLARSYIDQAQTLAALNARLNELESEIAEARSQLRAVEDECTDLRADLRAACGVST